MTDQPPAQPAWQHGWNPTGPIEPPPPPPTIAIPPKRHRWWPFAVLGVVVIAGGAAGVLLMQDSGPDYPDQWDARVLTLISFVERERDLLFDHPVRVDFLDEDEWKEQGAIDEEEVPAEDAQLLEHGTGGTVGRYSFEDEVITVRGGEVTLEVQKTLVHELTHVLQDQHFDIGDPISYLEHDEPTEVDPPGVTGEAIPDMEGDFGAVSWFLMLVERTDPVAALAAVDGWGGDSYRAYTEDDRTCVALRFVGEDKRGATAMNEALSSWVAAMPAEADAVVELSDDVVDLVTCDPGPDADLLDGEGRSRDTISVIAARSTLAGGVLSSGGTNEQARCFSRGFIANLDYELIIADVATPADPLEGCQSGDPA